VCHPGKIASGAVITPEALAQAQARLEREAPGYLARVRRRAAALARPATEREQALRSIALTVETAQVNSNVPNESNHLAGRVMKKAVSVLTRFYFLHLTTQVTEFAESSAWMGQALMEYTAALETEVAALRERVRCLEERLDAPYSGAP
jgi:hypothetical protein